ncbi:Cytochrome P450 2C42 [Microtus ochrogaster]|uniref:unspecific monooxygenase n=1 Tax=Microtus ochrogaster TaxID=79684 RepID=A0A8J6G4E4_MICOH|nr:Cytochrome P450 2C42 [Microtus ochrogaster]
MPYTDAVIHEIQRFIDITPNNLPHEVTCDVKFRNFLIPKDFCLLPTTASHFPPPPPIKSLSLISLKSNQGSLTCGKSKDRPPPSRFRKRVCIGEGLARMELFLFLTTILQNFKLKSLVPPNEINDAPVYNGFTVFPPFFQLCFIPV